MKKQKILTHKQRILNAIVHKSKDKHPIQIDFSPLALEKYLKYLKLPITSESQLLKVFDNHIVYAYLNDAFRKTRRRAINNEVERFDDWGVGWNYNQEGTSFSFHPLANIENYKNYRFPNPNCDKLMEGVKETVDNFIKEYIVSSYQNLCLFERCWALRGFENFLIDMMEENGFAEELLERVTEYQIDLAKNWIKRGINCGRTGDDYGAQNGMLMSPDLWRRMIKPRLHRIWNVYKKAGLPIIHHTCGDVRPIIPDFIDMGLNVLNNIQSEAMPMEELSKKFGEKLTFYGGISSQNVLSGKSPSIVKKEVKKVIQILGKYKGLIISTSVAITSDVPIANIDALLEAIEEFNIIEN